LDRHPNSRRIVTIGNGPARGTSKRSVTTREAETVVTQYFEMWNTGDTASLPDLIDPDWLDHNHPELHGPDGVAQQVVRVRTDRPDFRFHLEQVLSSDDGFVVVVGRTTHSTTASNEPPKVWRIRMRDGRMTEMWTYRVEHP
jgi:ketosteroid isomerase-like protein